MSNSLPHPVARTPEEWAGALAARGERAFRAKEVFRWIQRHGATDPSKMTSVPEGVRAWIAEDGARGIGVVEQAHRSTDDTRKLVVRLADGAPIETVLIPRVSGPNSFKGGAGVPAQNADGASEAFPDDADAAAADEDEDDEESPRVAPANPANVAKTRVTQCISTQVGCAMGCVFCASGVAGLKRHLGAEEIVGQVILARDHLDAGEEIRNVVYMGMGEPLHNYEATARSLRLLTHREGIALSSRRVTVSTSGLVPEILRLGEDFEGQIGLAISLHAADDETRTSLMPINRKYPLSKLIEALKSYPLPKRRRITIEYTLVAGQNDSESEARKLSVLLRGLRVKINLIPMNPIALSDLGPPDFRRVVAFQELLAGEGYSCFVRRRRGDDVAAACGQLALLGARPKVKGFRKSS